MRIRQTENKQLSNTNQVTKQKITACYERLSRDDGAMDDSSSIAHQKQMLESYAAQHGFTNCQHYTDDGWSGSNFDRPGWKKLLEDIDAGLIQTVLVKDMSRVGRDYLQTGFYTEVFFRERNIRFIAIGNGVDSADQSTSEFAPFLNIMNEWYLRDCSRKQRAIFQQRGRAGQPTTCCAIYGYLKDPADKHHWLVDEEAAEVVRRIFRMSIEGLGPSQIAKQLRQEHILRPSYYAASKREGGTQSLSESRKYDWDYCSVALILGKPEYMGHTVNFRTHKESYKDKSPKRNPPEEWLIFENTHEAIVDKETWQLAQRMRKVTRRTDTTGTPNPLTGLVLCADCGARMYNHRGRRSETGQTIDPDTGLKYHNHYECSTFNNTRNRTEVKCRSHYISTKALRILILDAIRTVSTYAISDEVAFAERVRSAAQVRQEQTAKELRRKVNKARKRSAELDEIIKRLYESYATGHVQESRFDLLLADYEREQAELKATLCEQEQQLDEYQADSQKVKQFLALAKKYTDFSELTAPMIHEFVEKILVHASHKVDGEREQEVEIYFNLIGRFEVPVPEATPEEIALAEKQKKRRAQQRECYYRRRDQKRAAQAQVEQQQAG